ncbi:MAG: sugar ABC transporter substrate-binding protein [Isosphaeraceae bacterium]|nr:sugar ABC transporter substrate-binding protein [Isosphaeraceae bacterium]
MSSTQGSRTPLHQSITRLTTVCGVALWLITGCDSTTFVPPPPSVLPALKPATSASTSQIELVLSDAQREDQQLWSSNAPALAGKKQTFLQVSAVDPPDPPSREAELIRAAIARRPSALIVHAADSREVAEALHEARIARIPLVLLERSVPDPGSESPVTVVTYPPFGPSAAELVAASRAAVMEKKLRGDGVAVILVNAAIGSRAPERTAALQAAIAETGLTLSEIIVLDGDVKRAVTALAEKLTANPKITMVFAEDDHGMSCATYVARDVLRDRPFTLAGYANLSAFGSFLVVARSAAVANRNEDGFIATAVDAALKLARGESVPARIEVPITVRRGRNTSTPDQAGDRSTDPR